MNELRLCTVCGERKEENKFNRKAKIEFSGVCRLCRNDKAVEYRLKNKDRMIEVYRKSYITRRSKILEGNRRRYQENKDKFIERSKEYISKHKEETSVRMRKYNKENKEKIREIKKIYTEKNKKTILKKLKEYNVKNPKNMKAHNVVTYALIKGELLKECCKICKISLGIENWENIQFHHQDYDQPLLGWWLCASHHKRVHARINEKLKQG